MRWLRSSMREFKIKDFLINSTLIPVDGVLIINLVRSRWPNIEKIVCVQSLKSRRVFNYHSPQRTHRVSTEFLLRESGKSRRARRAYCAHLVSQSKQSICFNLRMSVRGAGYLIKVPILTDVCGEERCLMTQKLG